MKPILSPSEMAEADAYTINELGVEGIELMARAGRSCVSILQSRTDFHREHSVLILAGTGNNGGDAFVVAEILRDKGVSVRVLVYGDKDKIKPDARYFYDLYISSGGAPEHLEGDLHIPQGTDWIIDGLLGTGLKGPLKGPLTQWVQSINQSAAKVFSIDIPTGSVPTGNSRSAVQADQCVTFQALKPAHVMAPSCFHSAKLAVVDIGIKWGKPGPYRRFALEPSDLIIPKRAPNSHKGVFGTLGILGGAAGMEGAAALAGMASLRMGVGKTRIFSEAPISPKFHLAALMVTSWDLDFNQDPYEAWVIGPGLSQSERAGARVTELVECLKERPRRTLWDADALTFFPAHVNSLKNWVITPHPGEAARLLNVPTSDIQEDREAAICELGKRFPNGWIVLKGARTLIRSPQGHLFVCTCGDASLAVAGSGDVLSGMIGSLLAQNAPMDQAVLTGVLRHAMGGENWSKNHPDYAMLPEDLIEDLTMPMSPTDRIEAIQEYKGYQHLYD